MRDDRTRPRPRVVWDTLRGSTLTHAHSRIPSVQTFELLQLKPSKLETFTRPTYELSNLRPPRLAEWGRVRRFSVFCSGGLVVTPSFDGWRPPSGLWIFCTDSCRLHNGCGLLLVRNVDLGLANVGVCVCRVNPPRPQAQASWGLAQVPST